MKMFCTEHDFQVDLENFDFNLKFHAERIQYKFVSKIIRSYIYII